MLEKEDLQAIQLLLEAMEKHTDKKLESMEQYTDKKLESMEQCIMSGVSTEISAAEQRIMRSVSTEISATEQRIMRSVSSEMSATEQRIMRSVSSEISAAEQRIMKGTAVLMDAEFTKQFKLLSEQQDDVLSHVPNDEDLDIIDDRIAALEAITREHTKEIQQLKRAN